MDATSLLKTRKESASNSAEEAAQEVSELMLFERFDASRSMPLSLSSTLKLTGPARSNQSRSDQASRDEGDCRLGGCPCDEGHGRERRRESQKNRSSLRVFYALRSKTSEENEGRSKRKRKTISLCSSPLPPPLPREEGLLEDLFSLLSPATGVASPSKYRSLVA